MSWIGHDHIREALQELADEEIQRRRWTASEGEVSSFTEAVEQLYDDSALILELRAGRVVYSPRIDDMLRELNMLLKKVDDVRPPEDVVQDPRMATVRRRAGAILREIEAIGHQA